MWFRTLKIPAQSVTPTGRPPLVSCWALFLTQSHRSVTLFHIYQLFLIPYSTCAPSFTRRTAFLSGCLVSSASFPYIPELNARSIRYCIGTHSFISSLIDSLIHWLIHSLIHSLIHVVDTPLTRHSPESLHPPSSI